MWQMKVKICILFHRIVGISIPKCFQTEVTVSSALYLISNFVFGIRPGREKESSPHSTSLFT